MTTRQFARLNRLTHATISGVQQPQCTCQFYWGDDSINDASKDTTTTTTTTTATTTFTTAATTNDNNNNTNQTHDNANTTNHNAKTSSNRNRHQAERVHRAVRAELPVGQGQALGGLTIV